MKNNSFSIPIDLLDLCCYYFWHFKDKKIASYTQLENLGKKVIKHLKLQGYKAHLDLNRNKTTVFFQEYSNSFKKKDDKKIECLVLNRKDLLNLGMIGVHPLHLTLAFKEVSNDR